MSRPFPSAGQLPRGLFQRTRGPIAVLLVCLVVAGGVVFALDRRGVTKYTLSSRNEQVSATPDQDAAVPTTTDWRPPLFTPGTPAPPFTLVDVRTGQRVSLEDYRDRKPVILLLSSFG